MSGAIHQYRELGSTPRIPRPLVGLAGDRLEPPPFPRPRPDEKESRGILERLEAQFEQRRLDAFTKNSEDFARLHRTSAAERVSSFAGSADEREKGEKGSG